MTPGSSQQIAFLRLSSLEISNRANNQNHQGNFLKDHLFIMKIFQTFSKAERILEWTLVIHHLDSTININLSHHISVLLSVHQFFLIHFKVNCRYLFIFSGELSKTVNSQASTLKVHSLTDSRMFLIPQVILIHRQFGESISQKKLSSEKGDARTKPKVGR